MRRVHYLGPRVIAELLTDIGLENRCMADVRRRLNRYAQISPDALNVSRGDRFAPSIFPVSV